MRVNTRQQDVAYTLPAPVGGLNGRDSLAAMDERDAFLMDNWLPGTATVEARKGSQTFVSSLGGPVKNIDVYSGATGDKLLAWAAGKVFNISTGVASELVAGKQNDDVITAMFSNAADNAQHLIVTTGLDTPYRYDGTSIANLVITGIAGSTSTLNFVFTFKARLYFAQRDKLGFYYLAPGAIQGAAQYYDLGQVSKLGGYLVAICSFSDTAGQTPNDYIVFITSKGECIVFNGYDPSSINTWTLIGRYYASQPIGRKCAFNFGNELVLLTLDGAIAFSEIRRAGDAKASGVINAETQAITSKLGKYLTSLNTNAALNGWQGMLAPQEGLLLISAPGTASPSGEYPLFVMNTATSAWSRITAWNGISYCVFNKRVYFGTFNGKVKLAFENYDDDGAEILLDCKQAYSYFDGGEGGNARFLRKHYQWANLLVSCNTTPPLSAQFNVDYVENQPEYLQDVESIDGAEWDTATWDLAVWGSDEYTQQVLCTLNRSGVVGSLWLRASIKGAILQWYATNYVFVRLSGLLI